jgi:hypothetical protein
MTNLTKTETECLYGIFGSDFQDGRHPVNNWIWTWSGNTFSSPRAYAGAVSSLVKKGLAQTDGQKGKDACVALTAEGWAALKAAMPEKVAEFAAAEA